MSEDVMLKLSELLEFRLSVLRLEVCTVMRVLESKELIGQKSSGQMNVMCTLGTGMREFISHVCYRLSTL